jgi:hypothetical protein
VTYDVHLRLAKQRAELATAVAADSPCFGAKALALGPQKCPYKPTGPVPPPAQAQLDRSALYADHCWATEPFAKTPMCTYGSPSAKYSVALIGNSHAGQWLPALQELMAADDFNITTYVASGCNVTTTKMVWDTDADATGCLGWSQRVMNATTTGKYDLVVTSALQNRTPEAADGPQSAISLELAGHLDTLNQWVAGNVGVLVVRDPPNAPNKIGSIPDCLGAHPLDVPACSGKRTTWLHEDPLLDAAVSLHSPAVTTVDLTDRFCSATTCFGEIGGVTVYFDSNHMTQTYTRTLAPDLANPLRTALQRTAAGS